ncbi:MAG: sensor protein [Verrucomicrobia bacterium]|nr:sensor protein [Verrucomicrobiota bacterium]
MDSTGVSELLGIDFSEIGGVIGLLVAIQALVVVRLRRLSARAKITAASSRRNPAAITAVHVRPDAQIIPPRSPEEWKRLAHRSRISQLGEMSAAMAHEVRQPLATIVLTGLAAKRELANQRLDPSQLVRVLDDIVKAGEHAGGVIQRMQGMTRLEPMPFEDIDVHALVADTLDLHKSDLGQQRVSVTRKLSDGLPKVRGDAVLLAQALGNFIRNSCDAMAAVDARKRKIVISGYRAPGNRVCFAVEDSGSGLAEEVLEKLYLPFQSGKPNGAGVGLSLCRAIAAAHGGEISGANNSSGVGATFILSLPAQERAENTDSESNEIPSDDLCCR